MKYTIFFNVVLIFPFPFLSSYPPFYFFKNNFYYNMQFPIRKCKLTKEEGEHTIFNKESVSDKREVRKSAPFFMR
ncbi:hypothetical protein ACE6H2_025913 [Prunus campanulata]